MSFFDPYINYSVFQLLSMPHSGLIVVSKLVHWQQKSPNCMSLPCNSTRDECVFCYTLSKGCKLQLQITVTLGKETFTYMIQIINIFLIFFKCWKSCKNTSHGLQFFPPIRIVNAKKSNFLSLLCSSTQIYNKNHVCTVCMCILCNNIRTRPQYCNSCRYIWFQKYSDPFTL